jgi:hypothetical protein
MDISPQSAVAPRVGEKAVPRHGFRQNDGGS